MKSAPAPVAMPVSIRRPTSVTTAMRASAAMLRWLNVPVIEIDPADSLADIPDRMRTFGTALGRAKVAETAIQHFEVEVAALRSTVSKKPRTALYDANDYTNGDRTLACDFIAVAGFANVARELRLSRGGILALEEIVMAAPDLVVHGSPIAGRRGPRLCATTPHWLHPR
ncbi:MAG: ABC transporter substrate-binding protein [Pseudomonadota bacterium]